MKKFIVDSTFWEMFPEGRIYYLTVDAIDNHPRQTEVFENMLKEASITARQHVTESPLSANPAVAVWRKAFQAFKTKKGARSSIEALLRRINKDHIFTPILPLVDIYNAVSLTYGIPCGAEDLDRIDGDLRLGLASGGESFVPLGAESDDPALPGELIYSDDTGAVCRNFNWREAERTMLSAETTRAVLVIEAVTAEQYETAAAAQEELARLIQEHFDVTPKQFVLSADHPADRLS